MTEQDIVTIILAAIVGVDRLAASVAAAVGAYQARKAAGR